MGVYPDNDDTMWLTDTANVGRGKNGDVSRVVVHVTAGGIKNTNQAGSAYATWSSAEVRAKMGVKYLSAHFVVELDGRVIQFVDTNDAAYGTGWLTTGSVHIEFAGDHPHPLTGDQLHYGARLIAWIAREHPSVTLAPTGTSAEDPGDPVQPGITCHKFIQVVWRAKPENKSKPFTPKSCPGTGIIGQLGDLARQARLYGRPPRVLEQAVGR